MDWPEDVAAELPAPRDDEPTSLRQDIADELSDHLGCALNRELHATPDETQAKQNVLTRFGNPIRLARRLWFDAMKERIMSQRITMIMSSVLAVTCLAALALTWMTASENRQVNLAILAKLNAASPQASAAPLQSPGWMPVKVRLVLDEKGGKPAEGYQVKLQGNLFGQVDLMRSLNRVIGERLTLTEKTGPDGTVDFGPVHVGQYGVHVTTPWGEHCVQGIMLRPGRPETVEFVCPGTAPQEVNVILSADWPDDLRDRGVWSICQFVASSKEIDGKTWESAADRHVVAISPSGGVFDYNTFLSSDHDVTVKEERLFDAENNELEQLAQLRWKGTIWGVKRIYAAVPRTVSPATSEGPENERLSLLPTPVDTSHDEFRAKPGEVNRWTITPAEEFVEEVRKKLLKPTQE